MKRPLRVLFVAHDAYRAGGTIFLLNMLRWMRAHTDLQFDLALPCEGEMVAEFQPVCRTFILPPLPAAHGGWCARLQGWWRHARNMRRWRSLQALVDGGAYDLLYLNTITLGEQLARLPRVTLPVLTHVHELSWAIRRYAHGQEQRVLHRSDRVVCVSDAVRDNLVASFEPQKNRNRKIPHSSKINMPVTVRGQMTKFVHLGGYTHSHLNLLFFNFRIANIRSWLYNLFMGNNRICVSSLVFVKIDELGFNLYP